MLHLDINKLRAKCIKLKGPIVPGLCGTVTASILADSGAEPNCISSAFYEENSSMWRSHRIETTTKTAAPTVLSGPGGETIPYSKVVKLPIKLGKAQSFSAAFYVVPNLPVDVLLGAETLTARGIDILNSKGCLSISQEELPFMNPHSKSESIRKVPSYTAVYPLHVDRAMTLHRGTETHVNAIVGKAPKLQSQLTILITGISPNSLSPQVATARGVATMRKGKTSAVIANLGMTDIQLVKGAVIGLCQVINENEYDLKELKIPDEPTKGPNSRMVNLALRDVLSVNQQRNNTIPSNPIERRQYLDTLLSRYQLPKGVNIGLDDINDNQLHQLLHLLQTQKEAFATDPKSPGAVDPSVAMHSIELNEGTRPINCGPRRVSPQQRRLIKQYIDDLLKAGIISPSRSPWSAPVVMVPKTKPNSETGEKEYRICIDYRRLNEATKREIYALPRIDDSLDGLGNSIYFSVMDLASGYFQIGMNPKHKQYTAFTTYDGHYEFNYMAMGLVNAPSTFQRAMDACLAGLKWNCVQIYLDDAIVASSSFEQHLKDLANVMTRFREAGFKLKASKCNFCCAEVEYLGHLVSKQGVKANPAKVKLISDWSLPTTASNLHSFLGLAGYYRRLIKDFAQREAPLRDALKEPTFTMGPAQKEAFQDLKACLMADPVIALPDFSGRSKFEIHTDASDRGISAILCQIGPDGTERVLQYASRMLTTRELKWHTQEKEALAIVWGCDKFRAYLVGTHFTVRTDHHSLQWLMSSKKGRLARWALNMSEFDYRIVHRSGKSNTNADVASRWPSDPPDDTWDAFRYYADPSEYLKVNAITTQGCPQCDITIEQLKKPTRETPTASASTCVQVAAITPRHSDLRERVSRAQAAFPPFHQAMRALEAGKYSEVLKVMPPEYLKGDQVRQYTFAVHNGLLCRTTCDARKKTTTQVLVPPDQGLQQSIIKLHHAGELFAHFGRQRTFAKINENYLWPKLRADVRRYTAQCSVCQAHKATAPPAANRQLRPSLPQGPNERLSVDLIGPFTPTDQEHHTYCLVMVDYFTKFAVTVPLRSKEKEAVADAIFNHWFLKLGFPFELQSDQGGEFANDLLARLNERCAVDHRVTTPYYPQANGQVERFNRTLKTHMAIYAERHPGNWDRYPSTVTYAYNTSVNETTGFSPYYLIYGREPRVPTDIWQGRIRDIHFDAAQYQTQLTAHLRSAYEIVRTNLHNHARAMQARRQAKIKGHIQLAPGQQVLMFHPNGVEAGNSWARRWAGPYTVIEERHTDVYRIEDPNTKRQWTVNVHKLRPFVSQEMSFLQPTRQLPSVSPPPDADPGVAAKDTLESGTSGQTAGCGRRAASHRGAEAEAMETGSSENSVEEIGHDRQPVRKRRKTVRFRNPPATGTQRTRITQQERERQRQRDGREAAALDEDASSESLKEYEIDCILEHRRGRGRSLQYLVQWSCGADPTWIHPTQITTTECLMEYWRTTTPAKRPRAVQRLFGKGRLFPQQR